MDEVEQRNICIKRLSEFSLPNYSFYLFILICVFLIAYYGLGINDFHSLRSFLGETYYEIKTKGVKHLGEELGSIYFYIFVIGIVAIELVIPAHENQKRFSIGFFHDLIWFLSIICFFSYFISSYKDYLVDFFTNYLSFLKVDTVSQWPVFLQIMAVLLIGDFLAWLHHYIRHKVPFFWYFHSIHHSQQEMNMFTDYRVHFLEFFIASTIRFIPFLSLVSRAFLPTSIAFILFSRWHSRIYHSNLKTNYGFLRYIFVTPQSHRIHHSCEEKHFDKNFGVIFSFWDFIFRTQYKSYDEYPKTGIPDANFPHENEISIKSLILSPIKQTIYPFIVINDSIRKSLLKFFNKEAEN
jgi:sterol desaturase/sphingolipid hydroxylase (fatty acid hydroxylase superfamily)